MKISYNWLKEYVPVELPADEMSDLLTGIGLEVGGVEPVQSIKGGLLGVVAGQVMTCDKHPNADRLTLCTVDVGGAAPLQIVCGAPNVAPGQKVWVATVGTILYPGGNDEGLTINKVKVRGEFSEGMICAEDELGLGEDHSGIMVLPGEVAVGTEARNYYQVTEDVVFDIDLTPNRSDATSHLGVAEDVAAYLTINTDTAVAVDWPQVPEFTAEGVSPITVEVRNSEACPRYAGLVLEGVRIGESPDWLKHRLQAVGVRPINNVVDVTNYVLHEMGQPLHAFDADRIAGNQVIVRTLDDGTPFTTLDEAERKLTSHDLMICDGNSKGMCIAGVFGGIGTGVTESTTRVFLESAHFNPEWVRRTSMHHLLRTDAARTFEKSTDPNVCVTALRRAADVILRIAGGKAAPGLIDVYPEPVTKAQVTVRWARIDHLIGVAVARETLRSILGALKMEIVEETAGHFVVAVPTNKADVTREADVIEEILRIYGFNNVPLSPMIEVPMISVEYPTRYQMRHTLGGMLSSLGFCEMMGLSMVNAEYVDDGPLQLADGHRVLINNTSNVSLSLMRPDLLISALETAQYNQNRQQEHVSTYEFGHSYRRDGADITEREYLTLMITGDLYPRNWRSGDGTPTDFYTIKKCVHAVLDRVGLRRYQVREIDDTRYSYGLRYDLDGLSIAKMGLVSGALCAQFDLRGDVFYAELDAEALYQAYGNQEIRVDTISRYPGVVRDLAFTLPGSVRYADLERLIRKNGQPYLRSVALFDIYVNEEQLGKGRKSYAVQLMFEDQERTLTDADVDAAIGRIVAAAGRELDARQR
ncbi:MAG: phenylalanine--tRNA ligase subunit beta [Saprospiraceae bacterium]|nr:phenylalanine--tRNA ligase subunit beta [Saprospiraceae bacterium]